MKNIRAALSELEQEKRRVEAAITALRSVLGGDQEEPGQTVIGAAVAHLREAGKPQTIKQLRTAIHKAGVSATNGSIQTLLMKREGLKKDLVRKGRGLWGLR